MSGHLGPIGEKIVQRVVIAACIIFASAFLYEQQEWGVINLSLPTEIKDTRGAYYTVTKVTDGDTLQVDMDGTTERVRLIGINTPETVDPRRDVQCFGKEASERMKDLAYKKLVRLETDPSQDTRDTYGRLLAYVYLEDGQMLNKKMIADGYAYEYTYIKPYLYQTEFRELQTLARTSKRGLWADNACGAN